MLTNLICFKLGKIFGNMYTSLDTKSQPSRAYEILLYIPWYILKFRKAQSSLILQKKYYVEKMFVRFGAKLETHLVQ